MDIYELVNKYIEAGYSEEDAIPKVAQDIILLKIGNSKYHKNITVKGGVVMHNISKDMRRATRDMDIDFIKYSLEDKSILNFIKELNNTDDGIKIKITGKIEPLHHQDYDGKRVYINDVASYKNKIEKNNSAINYYKKAKEFTNWVRGDSVLSKLTFGNAVDENGDAGRIDAISAKLRAFGHRP